MAIYSLKALNRPLLNKKIRHFTFNNKHITDNLIFNRLFCDDYEAFRFEMTQDN